MHVWIRRERDGQDGQHRTGGPNILPFFLSIPEWWLIFLLFVFFDVFRPGVGVCVSQLSLARRLRRYCPLLRISYETVSAQARAFELGL